MFSHNRNKFGQHNNHINSLAALAGKNPHAHSASLHKRACIFSRYAGCYVTPSEV
jgi:hypothetical protein